MIFFYKYLNKTILRSVVLRRFILLSLDAFLINLSLFLSIYFINDLFFSFQDLSYLIPTYLFFGIIIFIFSGQYKAITKYVEANYFMPH